MSGDVPKLISVRIRETQSLPAHLDDQITFGWLVFPRISGAQESGRASRYHEAPCCFFEQVSASVRGIVSASAGRIPRHPERSSFSMASFF